MNSLLLESVFSFDFQAKIYSLSKSITFFVDVNAKLCSLDIMKVLMFNVTLHFLVDFNPKLNSLEFMNSLFFELICYVFNAKMYSLEFMNSLVFNINFFGDYCA